MRIVVVGGAGFIGSAVSRYLLSEGGAHVLVVDKVSHTSSLASLRAVAQSPRYAFRKADIRDRERIAGLIQAFAPDAIVHAAIEKSTDRLIGAPAVDAEASLAGTSNLIDAAGAYWAALPAVRRERFRFLAVSSTAGVDQTADDNCASRIADRLVATAHETYGLPAIVSKSDATYGPGQLPTEPVAAGIIAALDGEAYPACRALPARLLLIDDHVRALALMLDKGTPGESYAIPGADVASAADLQACIERLAERHRPKDGSARARLEAAAAAARSTVSRPSPAKAQDGCKLHEATGWRPEHTLEAGLSQTLRWYLDNQSWWRPLQAAQGAGNAYGILRSA
jgi:dTDP-glucose 4,6-dehydratase